MITGVVRFSYLNAFEAKPDQQGNLKFSASLLIPKSDEKSVKEIRDAIQGAVNKGIADNKFTAQHVKSPSFKLALRDGDAEAEAGTRGPEYRGHWFLNSSNKNRPGVVGVDLKPIMDPEEFYSGCFGRADINFFPFNTAGNRGVGVSLNNLMKVKDGDRLDNRQSAETAFANFAEVPAGGDDELK